MTQFSTLVLALIPTAVLSAYSLVDEYKGTTFFNGFDLVNWNGDTCYSNFIMNYDQAYSLGLINTTASTVYIGSDSTNKVTNNNGRNAIEIVSKKGYTQGLFILDLTHMPYGCGVWPAFWLNGPNWPNSGEIDIIEMVNLATDDQSTLHTGPNCMYDAQEQKVAAANMTGAFVSWQNGNCSYQPGCSIVPNNVNTFGQKFNANGGGVFATVLDGSGIQMFFWTHDKVPGDITNKKPNPTGWGKPYANWPFGSFCTSNHFHDLQIIFDLYYCGWAGLDGTWKSQCQDNGGPANGQTCQQFVGNTPAYFKNAYWLINYVDVYQQ